MVSPTPDGVNRLGILGGSFDPVHMAHLIIAESVREALDLDLVLFLPASHQPLKEGRPVTPIEHRVAMVELAIANNPHFALSRVDGDRPGPSYTVDTLRILADQWGAPQMWFIVGSDSLVTFPRWRDPEGILAQARLAVVLRPGVAFDPAFPGFDIPQLDTSIDWIDAPHVDISSTDLRRRLSEGRSVRYRVPEAVWEYIAEHGLYR